MTRLPRKIYDVDAAHSTIRAGGTEPASTTGSASSQSIRERMPWRAIFGGIGEEKRRSHDEMVASMAFRSISVT